jgi:hypothetical protein
LPFHFFAARSKPPRSFPRSEPTQNKSFVETGIRGILFPFTGSAAPWPALNEERRMGKGCETFCTQLETRVDFFYFFRRNPLKSLDSDEQNQGNPSNFVWFCLDLFGRGSPFSCICLAAVFDAIAADSRDAHDGEKLFLQAAVIMRHDRPPGGIALAVLRHVGA